MGGRDFVYLGIMYWSDQLFSLSLRTSLTIINDHKGCGRKWMWCISR